MTSFTAIANSYRLAILEQNECTVFIGILPLLVANLRIPWSNVLTATDASPEGWGICERECDSDVVAQMGRWHERWRYKRLDVADWKPRERAFARHVFADLQTAGLPFDRDDDIDNYVMDEEFPEIPFSVFQPHIWTTVGMGKWGDTSEHSTIKEARAVLLAVRRLSIVTNVIYFLWTTWHWLLHWERVVVQIMVY